MSARLHPVCETPGVNDVLLRTCAPAALPQPELLVGQLLGRCERRALLRHFQLADFATDAEFLRHYAARAAEAAVAATGGSDAADGGGTAAAEAAAAAASSSADGPCTAAGGDDENDRAGPAGQVAARKASPLHTAFVTFAAVALAAAGAPPAAPSPPLPARTAAAPITATAPPSTAGSRLEMSRLEMSTARCGAARGSDTLCPTSASAAVGRKTTLIV